MIELIINLCIHIISLMHRDQHTEFVGLAISLSRIKLINHVK